VTFRTNTGDRLGVIEKSSEATTSEIKDLRLSIQDLSKVQPILLLQSAVSEAKINNISAAKAQVEQAEERRTV
jgi:hypothetical protein